MTGCYSCQYRGSVPGSTHSRCNVIHEIIEDKSQVSYIEILLASRKTEIQVNSLPAVRLNEVGIKNGWAMWPIDFDPVWVNSCEFFKEKGETFNPVEKMDNFIYENYN